MKPSWWINIMFQKEETVKYIFKWPFSIVKKRSILVYVRGFFWVKPQKPDISFFKSRLLEFTNKNHCTATFKGLTSIAGLYIYYMVCYVIKIICCFMQVILLHICFFLLSRSTSFHSVMAPHPEIYSWIWGGDSGIRSHLDFWWFLWSWFRDQPNDIPQAWNIKGTSITECVKCVPNITKKLKGNGKHGLNQLVLPMHHNASITLRRRTSSNLPLSSFAFVSSMLRC